MHRGWGPTNVQIIPEQTLKVFAARLDPQAYDPLSLSMWFLIHEISTGDPQRAIRFLCDIHRQFPNAPLIICEIVRLHESILSQNRNKTIMPEYLFFHDISGQGVLSWEMYQEVLRQIPYELQFERRFDELAAENKEQEPSAFIWCLNPKK